MQVFFILFHFSPTKNRIARVCLYFRTKTLFNDFFVPTIHLPTRTWRSPGRLRAVARLDARGPSHTNATMWNAATLIHYFDSPRKSWYWPRPRRNARANPCRKTPLLGCILIVLISNLRPFGLMRNLCIPTVVAAKPFVSKSTHSGSAFVAVRYMLERYWSNRESF